MFTGIIEHRGIIVMRAHDDIMRDCVFEVETDTSFHDIVLGESIACSGVCLTVVEKNIVEDYVRFKVSVSAETFSCTTLGDWQNGRVINLERSLMVGQRLSGHFVLGHVDGVATLTYKEKQGDSTILGFSLPERFMRYFNYKGSITIDGISLTVNRVEGTVIYINIIKHTNDITEIAELSEGDHVNFEVDVLARYILGDAS